MAPHLRYKLPTVAKIMGTTKANIVKTLKLGPNPTEEEGAAVSFKLGRPLKATAMTLEGLEWATSAATLRQQAGMSLSARTTQYNLRYWRPWSPAFRLNEDQLRKYYKGAQVTMQLMQPRVGRPQLEDPGV